MSRDVKTSWSLFLLFVWATVLGTEAFAPLTYLYSSVETLPTTLFSTASSSSVTPPEISYALSSALKKPSKTLSVVLEVLPSPKQQGHQNANDDATLLSMQLRKAKANALMTADPTTAAALVAEQATATGSFPGPCPIIYTGSIDTCPDGVTAIVVDDDTAAATEDAMPPKGVDIIQRVRAQEDDIRITTDATTGAYLVHVADAEAVLPKLQSAASSSSLILLAVDAMQKDNAEIHKVKALVQAYPGVIHGVVVQAACVGDGEDLEYASFCIDGLTKKRSSTFNVSGLTGSTNGHFGGVASSRPVTWRRQQQQSRVTKETA